MSGYEGLSGQTMDAPAAPVRERLQSNIHTLTLIVGLLTSLAAVGLFLIFLKQPTWQIGVQVVLYLASGTFALVAVRQFYPRGHIDLGMGGTSFLFGLALLSTAALMKGLGFPAAIVNLIFALIVSSATTNDSQANRSIAVGIFVSVLAALATDFWPYPQLSVTLIDVLTPPILGALFMVYVVMLAMQFVSATLRVRLVTAFIAIVVVPLVILSFIQSQFAFRVLRQETESALMMASQQVAMGVNRFIQERQNLVEDASTFPVFSSYLLASPEQRQDAGLEGELRQTMLLLDTSEATSTIYLSSFALLDMDGRTLYDTLEDRISSKFRVEEMRELGLEETVTQLMSASEAEADYFLGPARNGILFTSQLQIVSQSRSYLYISAPIRNDLGQIIGVLRARYDGLLLQDLLNNYLRLLGSKSYAILVDEYGVRIADTYMPGEVYKAVAPLSAETVKILQDNQRLPKVAQNKMLWTNYGDLADTIRKTTGMTTTFLTSEMSPAQNDSAFSQIGAITSLPSMSWKAIYLQTDFSDEALRKQQRQSSTLVTTIIAALIAFIAIGASQLLSQPILRLTKTAQSVSSGDLDARAPVDSSDEFGMLGAAFNYMTIQLRTLINQLEERVQQRTQEIAQQNEALSRRAQQLHTVSEVARRIVSAQELETLLSSITRLISERFGFYHVGIFLLNEDQDHAILRAANSEGGQRMLERQHRLPVGRVGMVGYVTGTGQPRIATDVGEDAVFFNNPDLPETRSEMTLPLKVGALTIGALDIQSTESNAFQEEDLELFATLADQVAIAIYNNQLYLETRLALEEAENLHRQYLRTEWAEDTSRRRVLGYIYNQSGTSPQQVENPMWKKVFATGEPVISMQSDSRGAQNAALMAVPITVRGETIGVIHVQDQGEGRSWSADEISVVNSIAGQVAVALENARLFENTVRRAEREKKVLQITAKIRSTNDPEEMMRIAVSELQQALHATRTQIYVRQQDAGGKPGSNGSNGHPSETT